MPAGERLLGIEVLDTLVDRLDLGSCEQLYGVDFCQAVVADLERKVEVRGQYDPATLGNTELATM